MATKIQMRRDTAANWTTQNPVLAQGEFGFETDTEQLKIGDGTTTWTSLAYNVGGSGSTDVWSTTESTVLDYPAFTSGNITLIDGITNSIDLINMTNSDSFNFLTLDITGGSGKSAIEDVNFIKFQREGFELFRVDFNGGIITTGWDIGANSITSLNANGPEMDSQGFHPDKTFSSTGIRSAWSDGPREALLVSGGTTNPSALSILGNNIAINMDADRLETFLSHGGQGIIFIQVATTIPTVTPINGGVLYTRYNGQYITLNYLDDAGTIHDLTDTGGAAPLPSYTVATVPVSAVAGTQIFVTDEVGGSIPAFWDGTNWRRVTDRAIIS